MHCPNCNMVLEDGSIFCGNCGRQIAPIYTHEPIVAIERQPTRPRAYTLPTDSATPPRPVSQISRPLEISHITIPLSVPDQRTLSPLPSHPTPISQPPRTRVRSNASRSTFILVTAMLLIGFILVGTVALTRNSDIPVGPSGGVQLNDIPKNEGHSNGLMITVNGLTVPPSGSHYYAWFLSEQNEQWFPLGKLTQKGRQFTLNFSSNEVNLLSTGNRLEITQEQGEVSLPVGNIVLSATFPPQAFLHIKHLLVSYMDTPHNTGLLLGLRSQLTLLNRQVQALNQAMTKLDKPSVRCFAQSMITIIEGLQTQLPKECIGKGITETGDGYGLVRSDNKGYLSAAATHISLAATQDDATENIKTHAKQSLKATDLIKQQITMIDQGAHSLMNDPLNTGTAMQLSDLMYKVLNGENANVVNATDGSIPEGIFDLYRNCQMMAQLTLAPVHK